MSVATESRPTPTAREIRMDEIFAHRDEANRNRAAQHEAAEAAEAAEVEAYAAEHGVTLEISICDQRRSYLATFATEAQALEFANSRRSTHAVTEVDDTRGRVPNSWTALLAYLYPTCEHGLSASLCSGPGHYSDQF